MYISPARYDIFSPDDRPQNLQTTPTRRSPASLASRGAVRAPLSSLRLTAPQESQNTR